MAICKKCGAKLVEGDKTCRRCGTPVRQYKATRRVSRTPPASKSGASRGSYSRRQPSGGRSGRVLIPIVAVVLVAIVIIVVIAAAGNGSDETQSGTTASISTPTPTLAPTPTPTPIPTTKDASEIALRLEDIGYNQIELYSLMLFHEGAESTYGVKFYKSTYTYQQFIFNEVAVFPSIELAHQAYKENESQLVADTSDPQIGDESWWYIGVGQSIMFRKANVLVKIRLTFMGDIKSYAKICADRIP